ncbi:MAG: glycosyltransferase, partial [Alphaproteobacteria bacterium]
PADSCMDVDFVANGLMPPVVREADVALFPNRCEGGTNLVAMECMAAGVPTILSANTGHLDLLAGPDVAYPLTRQRPFRSPYPIGTEGWGESDIDEIVETLEAVYSDRATAAARAARASAWMASEWNWRRHAERLLREVREVA